MLPPALSKILAICVLLFGIYLLISFPLDANHDEEVSPPLPDQKFNPPPNEDSPSKDLEQKLYHLGCYDTSNPINNSKTISLYLNHVQHKYSSQTKNRTILDQYNSFAMKPDFDLKVKSIARSFQKYLDGYYQIKVRSEFEQNYFISLQNSKRQFEACKQQSLSNFKQQNCVNTYETYQQSLVSFEKSKSQLESRIVEKAKIESQISNLLDFKDGEDDETIEGRYRINITKQNKIIEELDTQLSFMHLTNDTLSTEIQKIREEINKSKTTLYECISNQKIIIICKIVSENVGHINITITKENILEKIANKKKILAAQKSSLYKAKKLNQPLYVYEAEINKTIEEETRLTEQLLIFNTNENQLCSQCSEKKVEELRQNISKSELIEAARKETYDNLKLTLNQIRIRRENASQEVARLEEDLSQALKANSDSFLASHGERQEKLVAYSDKLKSCQKLIIDSKIEIQNAKKHQNKTALALSKKYQEVESIETCIRKKQYYEKLKAHTPQYSEKDQEFIKRKKIVFKTQISQFLLP